MSNIFISYDSSEKEFALGLKEALESLGYKVWVDIQNLEPSVLWSDEITKAIKQSIAFIYLISPKSIRDKSYCRNEFNDAEKLGKKIIPILLPSMTNHRKLPDEVRKYHWLMWDTFGDFPPNISNLERIIRTDFKWTEFHTKLTVDSHKWWNEGRKRIEHPLSKKEISDARFMFSTIKENEYPQPTQKISDYVLANENRLTWRRIITTFASVSILTLICIVAVIAIYQSYVAQQAISSVEPLQRAKSAAEATAQAEQQRADQEALIAHAGQLADQADALTEQNPILSFLLSVEAYNMFENAQTYSVLRKNAHIYSQVLRFINGTNYFESGRVTDDGQSFGPGDNIRVAAFSPDGKIIAFVVRDKIILQDLYSGEEFQIFTLPPRNTDGDDNYVNEIIFSPDSKTIVSDSAQGDVIFWDIENGEIIKRWNANEKDVSVKNFAFSSDSQYFVYTSSVFTYEGPNSNKLIVQNILTSEILCETNLYFSPSLTFIPQSNKIMSDSVTAIPFDDLWDKNQIENNIAIWDILTCSFNIFTFNDKIGRILDIDSSSNGKIIALKNLENDIVVWDLSVNQPLLKLTGKDHPRPTNIVLSDEGNRLAIGYENGQISIWNLDTKELIHELKFGSDRIGLLVFGVDENILLSNNILWDLSQNQENDFVLDGNTQGMYGVAFSPDGNLLASAGQDANVIVWDVVTKQELCVLVGHPNAVQSVYFISDNTIVSSDMGSSTIDSTKLTWNLLDLCPNIPADRKPVVQSEVSNIDLSIERRSDGLWIINANNGETIGNPLVGFSTSTSRIQAFLFNRNNSLLAIGGSDGTLTLYDVANTRLLSVLVGHSDVVWGLDFSPDNTILASASSDGTIRLWDVDLNSWLQKVCQTTGRNFTIEEWNLYFPSENYRITCSQWSVGQ